MPSATAHSVATSATISVLGSFDMNVCNTSLPFIQDVPKSSRTARRM